MALALNDRVQQTGTANTTVSFTLSGSVPGFQSFAVIGNGNTTYYSATDSSGNWEVGLGTYSTTGPTLTRTTILSSSNSNTAVTFSGAVNVFVTYPSSKSVYEDASGNVSPLGTITSGVWNGTTIPVAYGGTGVTTSSGASSVVLRDANQNITANRVNQSNTNTTAAAGTTALTTASSYIQTLVGTGGQTYTLPDATTLTTGVAFVFNNMATGTLTLQNFAAGALGTIAPGGAGAVFLSSNGTVGGTWDVHGYLPENVTWGTNALNLGTTVISNGTWQGGTIQPAYGGTGLTTFVGANNALYSSGASTLTAGTLPIAAGGTGQTTRQAAIDALAGAVTSGQYLRGDGTDVVMSAIQAADVPTLNQNTTGTASNVTGTVAIANGGTGATTNTAARTNLGATTVGSNFFTLTNPSAVTFPRMNLDNTVSALSASDFRTAIGAGTSSTTGTVTSVGGTGTVNGITLSGTVTSSGNLTLGGTLSGVSLSTQVTGTLPIANGGTGATTRQDAMDALAGAVTSGQYLRGNGTDVVMSAIQAADVPTLNQNTTGSSGSCTGNAATATTATNASNLTGGNITGNMIVANATSPNSYYLQFGDNTGWVYRFMTNVSGTPTVRFSFQDNGAFTAVNNITAYSDETLKKNWRPVQDNFVEKLAQVKSGIYDRTDIEATQAGVSAQDMEKLLAETVQKDDKGILSLAYGNAALVAAIELAKQVVELKKEIELLKAK